MTLDPCLTLMSASVAGIFLIGASTKVLHFREFEAKVSAYQLVPLRLTATLAVALTGTELVAGVTLMIPSLRRSGAVLALLLLATVTAAVQINLWRGRVDIDCGCGGADGQKLSYELVLRNLALIGLTMAIGVLTSEVRPINIIDVLLIAIEAMVAITFYFVADQLLANGRALGMSGMRR